MKAKKNKSFILYKKINKFEFRTKTITERLKIVHIIMFHAIHSLKFIHDKCQKKRRHVAKKINTIVHCTVVQLYTVVVLHVAVTCSQLLISLEISKIMLSNFQDL